MQYKSDEEKKKNINLLDCVKLFTVEKQLEEDDPWCVHSVDYCIKVCVVHCVSCMHVRTVECKIKLTFCNVITP